jgi:hypothetical protein
LVPAIAVAIALLGLGMCRLAARSDSTQTAALADWAASYLAEHRVAADERSDQLPFVPRGGSFRATG